MGHFLQIRVHLQYLGFPIANDALYLHSNVAKRSKRSTTADRAAKLTEASETLLRVKESSCITDLSTVSVEETINDAKLSRTALGAGATNIAEGEVICDTEREQHEKLQKSNENVDCIRSLRVEKVGRIDVDPSEISRETDADCQLREENHSRNDCRSTNANFVTDPLCTHCPNLEPSGCVLSVPIGLL